MQQRVGLARALVRQPEILLMDEPFGALDAQTRTVLQDELLSLWGRVKSTVLFITHDLDEAIYLSDQVVIMGRRPGRIKQVLEVKLPQPRYSYDARAEKEFARLRRSPGRASRRSYDADGLSAHTSRQQWLEVDFAAVGGDSRRWPGLPTPTGPSKPCQDWP